MMIPNQVGNVSKIKYSQNETLNYLQHVITILDVCPKE